MSDVTKKRERQARRLLRVCLREFEDGCLESYVDDYEDGKLEHHDAALCAVSSMARGVGLSYEAFLSCSHNRSHIRYVQHVENVFEGYELFFYTPLHGYGSVCDCPRWDQVDARLRRRWIYEACIEELARRRSEDAATSASEHVRAKLEATR